MTMNIGVVAIILVVIAVFNAFWYSRLLKKVNVLEKERNSQVSQSKIVPETNTIVDEYEPDFDFYVIPEKLGIKKNSELEQLVKKLESSLDKTYMQHVKDRVLKGDLIHESDYDWYLLEFKRFLIMASVMKNVPMYSEKVDEIWHEMLMFTKSYSNFCHDFVGEMIHHEPNTGDGHIGNPENDRAWFEYVYTQLFEVYPNTEIIYGDFFRHPIDKNLLEEMRYKNNDELMSLFFTAKSEESKQVAKRFIDDTKYRLKEVVTRRKPTRSRYNNSINNRSDNKLYQNDDYYTSGYLYHSLISSESNFEENMKSLDNDTNSKSTYQTEVTSYNTKSSCSGWSSCSSSNDSSSSSKSSCRSCSSCSSSSSSSSSSSCSSGSSCSSCSS